MIKREVGLGIWKRGDSSPSTHEHHKLQVLGESPLSMSEQCGFEVRRDLIPFWDRQESSHHVQVSD